MDRPKQGTHCQDKTFCPDGNCTGCKDGNKWCKDPRCDPYCQDCEAPKELDLAITVTIWIIIFILVTITIAIIALYGPTLVEYRRKTETK